MKDILIAVVGLLLLGVLWTAWTVFETSRAPAIIPQEGEEMLLPETPDQVACTADAKLCPDGSAVGRVGPSCEFAPCPGTTGTP